MVHRASADSPVRSRRRAGAPHLTFRQATARGPARWGLAVAAAIVAAVAFLVFRHTLGHGFVNWDDDVYVYDNPALKALSPRAVLWLFAHFYYFAYIPVTLASHALDVRLWGMDPHGHHLTNVALHAANAVWILILGARISRSRALLGAAAAAVLFAVHPLRAESVSWISDRKDLLCAFFLLPAVLAYTAHADRRGGRGSRLRLAASLALFVLAVLSKATAVVFPLVLLILDWLRGRRALLEKVPFLLVSAAVAALSLAMTPHTRPAEWVSRLGGIGTLLFPFYSFVFPIVKTLVPVRLSPIYGAVGMGWLVAGLVAFAAITAAAIRRARQGRRGILAAWLIYLSLLAPNVVGLNTGLQPVADRYSYLATIPLFLLLGSAITALWERGSAGRRAAVAAAAAALALVLVALAVPQAARWRSSESLWEYVVREFPRRRDYLDARLNLAAAYHQAGRRRDAARILREAAAIDSTNTKVLFNLGIVSYFEGDRATALACLRRATEIDPGYAEALYNRALIADQLGFGPEGVDAMVRAARLGWKDAREALASRGIAW